MKKENNGKDVTVPLVPSGSTGGVWGVGSGDSKPSNSGASSSVPNDGSAPHSAPVVAKPAPWARPSTENAESSNNNEVKPKSTHTPSKSWADAESDEEDEDDEVVEEVVEPARSSFGAQSQHQVQTTRRWDAPPPSYQGGPAGHLNQNRIYQRDTVIQQQPPAHPFNQNSFNPSSNNNNNNTSNFHSNNHFGGRSGPHPDSAEFGRNQIETTRMELQLLEQRKQRQQQQQQDSQQQNHAGFNQQSSYFRGFASGPPALSQQSHHHHHHHHPQQQQQQQQQQHYSGSGLLNSDFGGSSRDYHPGTRGRSGSGQQQQQPQDDSLWERARKKPIEAPAPPSGFTQQDGR